VTSGAPALSGAGARASREAHLPRYFFSSAFSRRTGT
jgi:hypothetical protein